MARAAAPARKPTPAAAEAALGKGDPAAAAAVARRLVQFDPSPAHTDLLRRALLAAAGQYADNDAAPHFRQAVRELADLGGAAGEVAVLHARAGKLTEALALADPATLPRVWGAAADRAVRRGTADGLPDDLRPAFEAVLSAFAHYEAGDDEAARTALTPVGLTSPFLEWKVLLRGLLAFTAGDDGRAAEAFGKLAPDRLPARVAAPIRATVDPAFRAKQPPAAADTLGARYRALAGAELADALRPLRAELGRDKSLGAAFRVAAAALPVVRRLAPDLEPRLARCLYQAVQHQGEPADLPKYRKLFGEPADDPDFHRLQAVAHDEHGAADAAARHWVSYEKWLATGPPGWPADVLARARAEVLFRAGRSAGRAAADPEDDGLDGLFGPSKKRKKKPSAGANPAALYEKAAALAPGWADPARAVIVGHVRADRLDDAAAVAERLRQHNPTAVEPLAPLADALQRAGRPAEALALRLAALAAQPLDHTTRVLTGYAYLAAGRRLLIDGDPAGADKLLAAGDGVCRAETPAGLAALRSIIARKTGRPADADALAETALAVPGARLAVRFFLATDSGLCKLKPADKKAADAALAAGLAGPIAPLEANLLYAAWDQYFLEGIMYRGQKTQEKKVQAAVLLSADGDGPVADFENLAKIVLFRHEWATTAKLSAKLMERFPANPVFPLALAECELGRATGFGPPAKLAKLLKDAERLATRSPEPRHRALLGRIGEIQRAVAPPDLFSFFANLPR